MFGLPLNKTLFCRVDIARSPGCVCRPCPFWTKQTTMNHLHRGDILFWRPREYKWYNRDENAMIPEHELGFSNEKLSRSFSLKQKGDDTVGNALFPLETTVPSEVEGTHKRHGTYTIHTCWTTTHTTLPSFGPGPLPETPWSFGQTNNDWRERKTISGEGGSFRFLFHSFR